MGPIANHVRKSSIQSLSQTKHRKRYRSCTNHYLVLHSNSTHHYIRTDVAVMAHDGATIVLRAQWLKGLVDNGAVLYTSVGTNTNKIDIP